jgi:hypothetical protein
VIRSLLPRSGCSTNSSGRSGNGSRVTGFIPVLDVRETEDDYVVMVDLPGVKSEDVSQGPVGRENPSRALPAGSTLSLNKRLHPGTPGGATTKAACQVGAAAAFAAPTKRRTPRQKHTNRTPPTNKKSSPPRTVSRCVVDLLRVLTQKRDGFGGSIPAASRQAGSFVPRRVCVAHAREDRLSLVFMASLVLPLFPAPFRRSGSSSASSSLRAHRCSRST